MILPEDYMKILELALTEACYELNKSPEEFINEAKKKYNEYNTKSS